MTRSFDPNSFAHALPNIQRQWTQSVDQVVNGGIEFGLPAQNSPTAPSGVNQGYPTQFQQANSAGVMIRVAAAGVTDSGASYNWTVANTGIVIKHNLGKLPTQFHIVDSDGAFQVFRTAPSTETDITLAPTLATVNCTLYIA